MGLYPNASRRALALYKNPGVEKNQSFGKANNYQLIGPFHDCSLLYVLRALLATYYRNEWR